MSCFQEKLRQEIHSVVGKDRLPFMADQQKVRVSADSEISEFFSCRTLAPAFSSSSDSATFWRQTFKELPSGIQRSGWSNSFKIKIIQHRDKGLLSNDYVRFKSLHFLGHCTWCLVKSSRWQPVYLLDQELGVPAEDIPRHITNFWFLSNACGFFYGEAELFRAKRFPKIRGWTVTFTSWWPTILTSIVQRSSDRRDTSWKMGRRWERQEKCNETVLELSSFVLLNIGSDEKNRCVRWAICALQDLVDRTIPFSIGKRVCAGEGSPKAV